MEDAENTQTNHEVLPSIIYGLCLIPNCTNNLQSKKQFCEATYGESISEESYNYNNENYVHVKLWVDLMEQFEARNKAERVNSVLSTQIKDG